jgi:hypothetical protein
MPRYPKFSPPPPPLPPRSGTRLPTTTSPATGPQVGPVRGAGSSSDAATLSGLLKSGSGVWGGLYKTVSIVPVASGLHTSLAELTIDVRKNQAIDVFSHLIRRGLTDSDLVQIRKNIETMMKALGNRAPLSKLNKDFQKAHAHLLTGCNFPGQIAFFQELKTLLLQSEQNARTARSSFFRLPDIRLQARTYGASDLDFDPTLPKEEEARPLMQRTSIQSMREATSQSRRPIAQTEQRRARFISSLQNLPQEDAFQTGISDTATTARSNGDDLFAALAGKRLSDAEILRIRERVADIKRFAKTDAETMKANVGHLVQAMLKSGEDQETIDLVRRMPHVTNEVYANFQAMPGTHTGKDELRQWTQLNGNRKKSVFLVDETNGSMSRFVCGNETPVPKIHRDREMNNADIVLYKTKDGFWKRAERQASHKPRKLGFGKTTILEFDDSQLPKELPIKEASYGSSIQRLKFIWKKL